MDNFDKKSIEQTPDNKPVVYTLFGRQKNVLYVGSAGRGNVRTRLLRHLREKRIPALYFSITQYDSIEKAEEAEQRKIAKEKPPYNKQYV